MSIELLPAGLVHAEVLAGMHRICFAEPWSAAAMGDILAMPGAAGRIAVDGRSLRPSTAPPGPAGLVLWRTACDEAEILTIAVLPPWRRHGLGRRLLETAAAEAAAAGAAALFLEVAANNDSALALYAACGFAPVGLRRGYYGATDGLTMRKELAAP